MDAKEARAITEYERANFDNSLLAKHIISQIKQSAERGREMVIVEGLPSDLKQEIGKFPTDKGYSVRKVDYCLDFDEDKYDLEISW